MCQSDHFRLYKKKGSDRDIGEKEEKEKGSEGAVKKRTFNYFPRPD